MKKAIFAICVLFALLAQPLAAQSSSIGGLGSDIDLFMLPNWAYLVSYNNIFSFLQGSYNNTTPGVRAGFGKKTGVNEGQLHFYFAGTGFALKDYTRTTEGSAGDLETVPYAADENGGGLTLQFDSLYSDSKIGAIKLGLSASGIRVDEDLNETAANAYTETKITGGTFTPSVEYGKNFYHDDGSMWTISLGSSVAIPFTKTVTEEQIAGLTTTITDTSSTATTLGSNTSLGSVSSSYTTWSLIPTFAYIFKPKVAPVYSIYSIYLYDLFAMRFYPEHLTTTELSTGKEGWKDRSQSYIYNMFYGYVDGQHYVTPSFLLRWRAQYGLISIFEEYGDTETKDASTGVVTKEKTSQESYSLNPFVGGWIGFRYQAIPSLLSVTGGVTFPIAGTLAYWYFLHTETTYADRVLTSDYTAFSGFYTLFSLGATLTLNSNVSFELGTVIDAGTQRTGLDSVALTLKYKN
jgi:hypothetical protein